MFAVWVKPSARKKVLVPRGEIWVNNISPFYVSRKERGLWSTRAEAQRWIVEPKWETIVEVPDGGVGVLAPKIGGELDEP